MPSTPTKCVTSASRRCARLMPTRPSRRLTIERSPSAPITSEACSVRVAPSSSSTSTPMTRPLMSRASDMTRVLSRTRAPAARAVSSRMPSSTVRRSASPRSRNPRWPSHVSVSAVERRAVRSANAHASEVRGAGIFDALEHAHVIEDARGLRAHVLGARLVAREPRAVEHKDVDAAAREVERRRGTGRPAADDDDLRAAVAHGCTCVARRRWLIARSVRMLGTPNTACRR